MGKRYALALLLLGTSLCLLWLVFFQHPEGGPGSPEHKQAEHYAKRQWSVERAGKLNISVFTFRDRNRNGHYDLGDLPLASVAVRLIRPEGESQIERSNINGFANFTMSLDAGIGDISQPGEEYVFEVLVPPGWTLTTANPRQESRFIALPGSVAGLVAEDPPAVVGLAQELTVSGRLEMTGDEWSDADFAAANISLATIDPDGRKVSQVLDQAGAFSFPARPGHWLLVIEHGTSGVLHRREFEVVDSPVQLSAIAPGRPQPAPLTATVTQDFEYLVRSVIDKIPAGRGGLHWDYLLAVDNQQYRGPGYVNGLISGKMVAYNSSGHPVTIQSAVAGEPFDFVGAYFAVAWPSAEGEILIVDAWRGDTLIGHDEIPLSYLGPVWFQADFQQIDKIRLATEHYWQFITDDMQFRSAGDAVHPD